MIKFAVYRNNGNKISGLTIKGHAGYGEEGYDIVCAAVSTTLWMAIKGIETQGLANVSYEQHDGFVSCNISSEREPACDAILNSLMMTISELSKQYKKNIFIVNGVE
ncbi:MAG: ribosomal-processing cysteine protease Prp [Oscillospiraceae bacterium]|nr:ribosomal-processing cysteine protease Prp [Oscillospiraceae bacterium]